MKSTLKTALLISASFVVLGIVGAGSANAQSAIGQFDSAPGPVMAPIPNGSGDFGNYDDYIPHLPFVFKPKYQPNNMPAWGPAGLNYSFNNGKWTSRSYKLEAGDIIIAVNDRRVRSAHDLLHVALPKVRGYVVLTICDPKVNKIYCVGVRTQDHDGHKLGLYVSDSDNFFWNNEPAGAKIRGCMSCFEGFIYKPTCPFDYVN